MKKYIGYFLLLQLFYTNLIAQDQRKVDSLLTVLSNVRSDSAKADVLLDISELYWFNNLNKGIGFANQSLQISNKINFKKGIVESYFSLANLYMNKGDFLIAKDYSDKILSAADKERDEKIIAMTYANLGFIYVNLGNLNEAQKFCHNAINFSEKIHFLEGVIVGYTNLGTAYYFRVNDDEALKNHKLALKLAEDNNYKLYMAANYHNISMFQDDDEAIQNLNLAIGLNKEMGNKLWLAYNYNSIGFLFQNNLTESIKYFQTSIDIAREIDEYSIVSTGLINIGELYMDQKNYGKAKNYFEESLTYQEKSNSILIRPDLYRNLASLDTVAGDWKSAFKNQRLQMIFQDSVINAENTKKMLQASMQFEFDRKEALTKAEQEKKDIQQRLIRNSILTGLTGALIFLVIVFRQRNRITKEKVRSDELLLNILPPEVAKELKDKGSADAKQFDVVTVMFTDFKGFTQISEKLTPSELVAEIHHCFKSFDDIITKYNIEKIKTIGDAYMCAGGLPVINKTNAVDVVNAALDIQKFIQEHLQQREKENKPLFEIRIGIHTGPVVAGIVGVKKFAYDIWGDTVNIASRMESSGEVNKVNISGSTYELVKDKFTCTYRGKIQAKNKGEIDMYFVEAKV